MGVALLGLFVALGGGAYAAVNLPKDSVGSKQIKANAVRSSKVKDGSLLRGDFKAGQIPPGQPGAQGLQGIQGVQGVQGERGFTGPAGRSALEELRSGETVRGAWALRGDYTGSSAQMAGITLPIPAPAPVDSAHVVVVGNDPVVGDGCSGTADAPVSNPGFVCIYFKVSSNTAGAGGVSATSSNISAPTTTGDGSRYGFIVTVSGTAAFAATGTWAYTAP
jgi:hypothetical protein